MAKGDVVLNRYEARALVKMLGILQDHLGSVIEFGKDSRGSVRPKTLAQHRKDWNAAQDLIRTIQAQRNRQARA